MNWYPANGELVHPLPLDDMRCNHDDAGKFIEKGSHMSVFYRHSFGAVVAYTVATQGAFADLTANDVWADWQAYLGGMGYTVTGDSSVSGDVTTISNITMALALPEAEGQMSMVMPEMTLTENGDGTVGVGFPDSFPLSITGGTEGDEDAFSAKLLYENDGLDMVVSGSPEEMTYDYSANSIKVSVDSIEVDGEVMPSDMFSFVVTLADTTGKSLMKIGENRDIKQSFNASSLDYNLAFQDPESGEDGLIKGALQQLEFEGDTVIPTDFDVTDVENFYASGFAASGTFSYGAGKTDVSGTSEGQPFSMASASEGGRFQGGIDAERIVYDLEQKSTQLAVTTADLPFPIEMAMAKAGLNLEMPVQASEEVQPFGFGLNLTDFTMSDVLWSMFDPAGALPRDPATIALDTTGTAKVLVDFMDPEVAETLEAGDVTPGELHSLKINELLISLVGAELSGGGDFTFDNATPDALTGMPTPSGVANLKLVGANALIDKLIGMGFVSENDAMGARMMMGLMAVPGEEPDTLTSNIEFTEDGQILANGQRIK